MSDDLNKQRLLELMTQIAPGRGIAEHGNSNEEQVLKNFLPVADYRRVLEPDTLLVLGGRGVGKTELFKLLAIPSGRQSIVSDLGVRSLPDLSKTDWLAVFGSLQREERRQLPSSEGIEERMKEATSIDWRTFWIGLIVGVILRQADKPELKSSLIQEIPSDVSEVLENRLSLLSEWIPSAKENIELLNYSLDKLDENLVKLDKWLFLTYDELDRLLPTYVKLASPIRELLAFWLDKWRRWERIRPKIFLRTDLFREDFLGFPDASKLQAHQVRLEWKYSWL